MMAVIPPLAYAAPGPGPGACMWFGHWSSGVRRRCLSITRATFF